jgi:hypothetical protein
MVWGRVQVSFIPKKIEIKVPKINQGLKELK